MYTAAEILRAKNYLNTLMQLGEDQFRVIDQEIVIFNDAYRMATKEVKKQHIKAAKNLLTGITQEGWNKDTLVLALEDFIASLE